MARHWKPTQAFNYRIQYRFKHTSKVKYVIKCFPESLSGDTALFPLNTEVVCSAWVPACSWLQLPAPNSFSVDVALKQAWAVSHFQIPHVKLHQPVSSSPGLTRSIKKLIQTGVKLLWASSAALRVTALKAAAGFFSRSLLLVSLFGRCLFSC